MRTCPKCQAEYDDSMSFCTADGMPLADAGSEDKTVEYTAPYGVSHSEAATEVMTGRRTADVEVPDGDAPVSVETQVAAMPAPRHGTAYGVVIGIVAAAGLLLVGSAIGAGIWFLRGERPVDIATINSNLPNQPQPTPAGTPAAEGQTANLPPNSTTPNANAEAAPSSSATPTPTPRPEPSVVPSPSPSPTSKPDPAPGRIRTISGGVLNGKALVLPQPAYPPAARAVGANGTVNVRVLVNQNGNVVKANAVSGHPLLRKSAERAARGAVFPEFELGGQPVRTDGVIVYVFRKN